jgi:hypothetical protein
VGTPGDGTPQQVRLTLSLLAIFKDIEREAMMQLHAGGTQNRA